MEGWFPCRYEEQICSRIAQAAECRAQPDERSREILLTDPAAGLPHLMKTRKRSDELNALPNVRVDARCQSIPGPGEVRLDTSLHGRDSMALGRVCVE